MAVNANHAGGICRLTIFISAYWQGWLQVTEVVGSLRLFQWNSSKLQFAKCDSLDDIQHVILGDSKGDRNMLKKLTNKKLISATALYYRHKLLTGLGQVPILVYTMGKVGSTTVYNTLRRNRVSPLVYHIHFLSDFYLGRLGAKYTRTGKIPEKLSMSQVYRGSADHMTASHALKRVWETGDVKKWRIITLVRDPVASFLSHIFQNPTTHRPDLLGEDGNLDRYKVETHVVDYFEHFDADKDFISGWFDREFCQFTGTDVYKHPFDPSTGYQIVRDGKLEIAVMLLDELPRTLNRVIMELTGQKNGEVHIINENIRGNGDGGGLYGDLKRDLVIPRVGLEKAYSTKYATHFFSDEERERMIEKWSVPRS